MSKKIILSIAQILNNFLFVFKSRHIDHIKPLCTFSSDTPVNIVNSLENLRPLWAEDNLKRKKYQNL
jgi:hypothetical protein